MAGEPKKISYHVMVHGEITSHRFDTEKEALWFYTTTRAAGKQATHYQCEWTFNAELQTYER